MYPIGLYQSRKALKVKRDMIVKREPVSTLRNLFEDIKIVNDGIEKEVNCTECYECGSDTQISRFIIFKFDDYPYHYGIQIREGECNYCDPLSINYVTERTNSNEIIVGNDYEDFVTTIKALLNHKRYSKNIGTLEKAIKEIENGNN